MKIIKRNGDIVDFDNFKIVTAIEKAMKAPSATYAEGLADVIAEEIRMDLEHDSEVLEIIPDVYDIESRVYYKLIEKGLSNTAKEYEDYRAVQAYKRLKNLDETILELVSGKNDEWNKENSNKNARLVTTQRDYMAGTVGKDISRKYIMPKAVLEAHDRGAIHVHDTDYLAEETRTNCELINLDDMLQNGTVINGYMIERPNRFITASTIATQIITGVTSATYGGATITLSHLVPFVNGSRQRYRDKYLALGLDKESAHKLAEADTRKEVEDGVQTFNYQIVSMSSTNGQSPFLTAFMYLNEVEEGQERDDLALIIEEMLKQRIEGLKNRNGTYVAPAFPKLILCLDDNIMNKDSKYHYLMGLAAECTAKRLVPDYISEKKMKELKINGYGHGDVYPAMGCRSFLTPDRVMKNVANALNYEEGKGQYYGRFNIGVTTLNLPYIALEAREESNRTGESLIEVFDKTLEHYAELAHDMQRIRAERLMNTKAEVAPILWCDGALARLKPTDTIDRLITGGYATSSLGYSGLYEAVKVLTGKNHYKDEEGHEMGVRIMEQLNSFTDKWKADEDIDYSLYGAPKIKMGG